MSALTDKGSKALSSLSAVSSDLDTALGEVDWRENIAWPVAIEEANNIARSQARHGLDYVRTIDDRLVRDTSLLALPTILAYSRAIYMAGLALDRAGSGGPSYRGAAPEFVYLRDGEGPPPARSKLVLPPRPIRLSLARRIARIRSWSSWAKVPGALFTPSGVAITHNPLLCHEAALSGENIGFIHAESMLQGVRSDALQTSPELDTIIRSLAGALLKDSELADPYLSRVRTLFETLARTHLQTANIDMRSLREKKLPETIWSGSGGIYAARAVGLEVLRRGGKVVRFDHGTPKGFVDASEINAIVEFSVSSEVVVATPAAAKICRRHSSKELTNQLATVRIRGGAGDPVFSRASAQAPSRRRGSKPRVVYAPTQLLGFRQLLPVQQPDVVYLDWQFKVAEALSEMPIHLICQPHPEGYFGGRPHPLEKIAKTRRNDFDDRLGETDIFIFDYPSTTALWEAVCTTARVVYLDLGAGKLTPRVSRLFAKRATLIPVAHDEENRPILDPVALRDAVMAGGEEPDPEPIRQLLAGAV
jgi:hypothetical protein